MKKLLLIFALFSTLLFANIGSVTIVEGEAFATREGKQIRLNLADKIEKNDFIETKIDSKIKITFIDNTMITIGKESSLKIEDYFFDPNNHSSAKTELNVSKGAFHTITGQIGKVNPSKFKLKTKNATIGIRGTEIYGDQNRVFCTQGAIFVNSFGETREVANGFFVNTFDNAIPSQSRPIDSQQFQDINSDLNTNNFNNSSAPLNLNNQNNQDNQNSWGYWAGSLQDENNNARIDNSIQNSINSSNITDPAYVQNLMDNTTTTQLNFSGTITPNMDVGTISENNIHFNFNFGGRNNYVDGGYEFSSDNFNSSDSFYGSVSSDGFGADGSNSSLNGKFYGPSIDKVSGNITMVDNNSSNTLNGTFSANKVP
ncbi:FecR family protein [Arcobacter sp. AHV-9/2010]|uniref:FecR family protein n=1 Tax=Arcobacter sp. AHV-9/2010 TaxID=2021861 RepID=UPI0013E92D8C|nr:FecR family protein [Arcobacter sp. CECT 9299]